MVHHRSEPYRSIVIERGQRDNQTAASAQLGRPQPQECLPVPHSLAIELGPDRARGAGNEEVVRDLQGNLAKPDGGVGTPSEIDVTGREQGSIKRAADRIRKDLRFALQIAFWVALQQREHFAEVVGWEVGVAYENRPLPTGAHA